LVGRRYRRLISVDQPRIACVSTRAHAGIVDRRRPGWLHPPSIRDPLE
jgi:hypothetical protein